MKRVTLFVLLFLLFSTVFSQNKKWIFQLRLPLQLDRQEAELVYSWGSDIKKATTLNFGLDALINYQHNKFLVYTGIGFFRNQFNLKRGYDHMALNIGRDSLPIGTSASNYTYSLLRLPVGISFICKENKKIKIKAGAEYIHNISFRRKYNGRVPFPGANTVYKGVTYFGNAVHIFASFSTTIIEIEPFVRVYNSYKKDRFLNEEENETITRHFDAIGISFRYTLSFHI